jgi:diguanylate cyclase (GGDEF)-like protein
LTELPLILSFVFAAIAAGAIAWALWIRQTMAREAELVQLVRERTAQLEEANRRLEALSYQDALTGVANRRALDEALDIEWRRGIRSKRPLSFLLLDIDHFKGFNDTYGHPAGDRALARVAAALGSVVRRAGDRIARYGGEEFAALLPETDRTGADAIAERMRTAVEALAIPNPAADSGCLTLSVGHTTVLANDSGTQASVVAAADRALYEAKREGRNRARGADITVPSGSAAAAGLRVP